MARDLDVEYPMGNPESKWCRHCKDLRMPLRGALICDTCDGPARLVKPE